MQTSHVLVVGSLNMDFSVHTPNLPNPGETVTGGELRRSPGGKGANQATAARLLGSHVSFVGAVGDDDLGMDLVSNAEAQGIDASRVHTAPNTATGTALITVDEHGENTIVVSPGANASLLPANIIESEDVFAASNVLCLSLEVPLATVQAAVQTAKRSGTIVILNLSPCADVPQKLLEDIDVLLVNSHEASYLLGHSVSEASDWETIQAEFLHRGLERVVVTLGSHGAVVLDAHEGKPSPIEPIPVSAVDTTGCGDAFFGAVAGQLAAGTSLRKAVFFAVAASALAATQQGTQASYPTLAEVRALLAHSRTW